MRNVEFRSQPDVEDALVSLLLKKARGKIEI